LGEGGSLFAGFVIGVLAILSGSKIATTLLVFGIPILDVVWVIGRRFFSGRSIFQGDKRHLHHRLLNIGLSHRNAVLLVYALTSGFGVTALFLQTTYKLVVLGILGVFFVALAFLLMYIYNKRNPIHT
jgi:UDP-GlcNAc:undecaprenyl-phosphate GlcNAc-1-phosphate transferase